MPLNVKGKCGVGVRLKTYAPVLHISIPFYKRENWGAFKRTFSRFLEVLKPVIDLFPLIVRIDFGQILTLSTAPGLVKILWIFTVYSLI